MSSGTQLQSMEEDVKQSKTAVNANAAPAQAMEKPNPSDTPVNTAQIEDLGGPTPENYSPTVNLDRVSHKIISLRESGSNFIGKAKILESTPMGKIASGLLSEGVKLGVSSRGIGSLKPTKEGFNVVSDDFMLATAADIVADPSAPDAFVEGVMEGKEWVWEGTVLKERKAEEVKSAIDTLAGKKRREEHKIDLVNEFINSL